MDDAVVILGIADRHIDDLDILTGGGRDNEGRHALADRDVHIARGHCCRHRGAGVEGAPVDGDAQFLLVDAHLLGILERHRPFEEIGNGQFVHALRDAGGRGHG
jgi:hypothetical protein